MKNNKITTNKFGFSMVEIMIAAGLVAVLALAYYMYSVTRSPQNIDTGNLNDTGQIEDQGNADNDRPVDSIGPDEPITATDTFVTRLPEVALQKMDGLMPIHGFTPDLYLRAFPGLAEADFDNVQALQGLYIYERGELKFEQDTSGVIHSAATTVSEAGLKTLYSNILVRMDNDLSVEELIITLSRN